MTYGPVLGAQVLLLLWKVLLTSLGGMDALRALKTDYRGREALPEVKEDTLSISRQMRAASPPGMRHLPSLYQTESEIFPNS